MVTGATKMIGRLFKKSKQNVIEKVNLKWAVVTTVKAQRVLVDQFVEHYLSLGCSEIHIFFDDTNNVEIDKKYSIEKRVIIHICDDSYWENVTPEYPRSYAKRASNIENRQCANFHEVYKTTTCQWLLHADIDEYMLSHGSIEDILDSVPGNIFSIAALPYEAVYITPPSTEEITSGRYFKSLLWYNKETTSKVYSEDLIPMKSGFWGHTRGKGFTRVGHVLRKLSCHFPTPLDENYIPFFYSRSLELLHFECLSPELFIDKRIGRITRKYNATRLAETNKRRLEYAKSIYEKNGESGLRDLYTRMNIISKNDIIPLIDNHFIVERTIRDVQESDEKYTLWDHHGKCLCCSDHIEVISSSKKTTSNNFVFIEAEPAREGKAYLYTVISKKRYYLGVDKRGSLIPCSEKNALLFNKFSDDQGKVSLSYNGVYLKARPNGRIFFGAEQIKDWEKFDLERESVSENTRYS